MSQRNENAQTQTAPCDIVGIGVSVWDTVLSVEAYPKHGAVVRAKQRINGIGGGITVAMATAARLGSTAAMIDSLGDDDASARILRVLRDEGVQTGGMVCEFGHTSSVASIWSDTESNERTIVYSPGTASGVLQWSTSIEQMISRAKIVHLNGRHPEVCLRAIRVAKEGGAKISFDGGAYRYRDEILPMFSQADIVIVAHEFAHRHYRRCSGQKATPGLQRLTEFLMSDLSCDVAGVTNGVSGSFLIERCGEGFHQPAIEPEGAIDTTGCGDTYHGAFLHSLANGQPLKQAAELAARVASANARGMGALAFSPEAFTSP